MRLSTHQNGASKIFHPRGHGDNQGTRELAVNFNTKIWCISRHISTQFWKLYQNILFHRCNLERQCLMNALSQVKTDPEAFATLLMKERGYTVYAAGVAVHIVQCQPIQCTINHLKDCYHELPVICEDKAVFLKPNSRIITNVATPVDCNRFLATYFELQGIWYQLVPQVRRITRYHDSRHLSTRGIREVPRKSYV